MNTTEEIKQELINNSCFASNLGMSVHVVTLETAIKILTAKAVEPQEGYTKEDMQRAFNGGRQDRINEVYDESDKGFDHWLENKFPNLPPKPTTNN